MVIWLYNGYNLATKRKENMTKKRRHKQVNIYSEDHDLIKDLAKETNKSMSKIAKESLRLYKKTKI